jgi:hypothetical protein
VLIYELAGGLPPFYDEDRLVMFQRICDCKLRFPPQFTAVSGPLQWFCHL